MQHKNKEFYERILDYIEKYNKKNINGPTVREISEGTCLSTATVSRYISDMRDKGEVSYCGHRNIKINRMDAYGNSFLKIPIVGNISCGAPIYAEENIESYFFISQNEYQASDYFFLKAKGDSMIDIGIFDGDLVLIKRQQVAEQGQVIVALIDDEATLKRYYRDEATKKIRLHPENSNMEDIIVDDCAIQGIAVKVLKDVM